MKPPEIITPRFTDTPAPKERGPMDRAVTPNEAMRRQWRGLANRPRPYDPFTDLGDHNI